MSSNMTRTKEHGWYWNKDLNMPVAMTERKKGTQQQNPQGTIGKISNVYELRTYAVSQNLYTSTIIKIEFTSSHCHNTFGAIDS